MNCVWLVALLSYYLQLTVLDAADGRNVAALTDYCGRFPFVPLCGGKGGAGAGAGAGGGFGSGSPPLSQQSPGSGGSSTDVAQYCSQYLANYRYYCTGAGQGDQRVKDFCPSYTQICNSAADTSQAGQPGQSGQSGASGGPVVSNNPLCAQYAPIAQQYCTGPESETAQIKQSCDQYRAACSAPGATPVQPVLVNSQQAQCYLYQQQFLIICVQQRPSTAAALQFCQQFAALCLNQLQAQGRKRR